MQFVAPFSFRFLRRVQKGREDPLSVIWPVFKTPEAIAGYHRGISAYTVLDTLNGGIRTVIAGWCGDGCSNGTPPFCGWIVFRKFSEGNEVYNASLSYI